MIHALMIWLSLSLVFFIRYAPFGRSFFSPELGRRRSLGEGIESWRGFYQSIRPTQMGLSLNIGKTLSVCLSVCLSSDTYIHARLLNASNLFLSFQICLQLLSLSPYLS